MAKMKTHRASAKRFKRTGTGKIKRFKKTIRESSRSTRRIRNLRKSTVISSGNQKRINHMIP